MYKFYGFLFFILPLLSYSQKLLKGTVVDAETAQPISSASIFLNNTSIGTTANGAGSFQLEIPAGKYDLIVSSIGYETANQTVIATELPSFLTIKLIPKVKELETVVVEPFERDGWERWGRFFIENFIGTSSFAKACRIKNSSVLKFRNSKKRGELTAFALEPLLIENPSLGYTIQYQLENFSYNFKTHFLLYQGYPFFKPMKGSAARQRRWQERREAVFYGSMMHFMRGLYRNTVREEGFEVRRLQKVKNSEKERVRNLYARRTIQTENSNGTVNSSRTAILKDSSIYYDKILNQADMFDIIGNNILPGDSVAFAIDSVTAGLSFDNYLLIIYKNKVAPVEYQRQYRNNGSAMASQIFLINNQPVEVQSNGNYYNPIDLTSLGYWSWSEKIALMLPFDYSASKKVKK